MALRPHCYSGTSLPVIGFAIVSHATGYTPAVLAFAALIATLVIGALATAAAQGGSP